MKLNYRILILTFFAFTNLFAFNSNDEIGSLSGKVLDAQQQPIIGASVVLKGTVRGAATNDKGEFTLKNVETGIYILVVSSLGSQIQEKTVNILRGQTTVIDFQLAENDLSLQTLHVVFNKGVRGNDHMAEVSDYKINATKKNEVIRLDRIDANLAMNNTRQIFGRIPGIHIWESDGSGIQPGLASRGLSPNRSWEFNVRMNGYDITPDPMGYPEAYYNPPR